MKTPHQKITLLSKATAVLAVVGLFLSPACTTTATQQQVLSEPMTSDLEAKVLKETGISGALIGALATGAATGALTFATLAATGASLEQAAVGAAIGGAAGAAAGGVAGYQQGKKQGQKMVAQAMTRDQVRQLVQGARDYNVRLAKNNATLKAALQRAKTTGDKKPLVPSAKKELRSLKSSTSVWPIERRHSSKGNSQLEAARSNTKRNCPKPNLSVLSWLQSSTHPTPRFSDSQSIQGEFIPTA